MNNTVRIMPGKRPPWNREERVCQSAQFNSVSEEKWILNNSNSNIVAGSDRCVQILPVIV